jgi:glycosyltransferase involved in cell wall biosynthesis
MTRLKIAVLHVAHQPITGPWSVMRELAKSQARSGLYVGVGFGLVTNRDWPAACERELKATGLLHFRRTTPKMFGTGSFVFQYFRPPGIESWTDQLARSCGATRTVVHFHNAWMAGVFLPLPFAIGMPLISVATVHGMNADFQGKPVRKLIHRWMAGRLVRFKARLTSVDMGNTHVVEKELGIPARKFVVIPNGVGSSVESGVPYLTGAKTFTVGFVGSLMEAKGWRLVVEAVERLRLKGCSVRVLLAGTGPDEPAVRELAVAHPDYIDYVGFAAEPQHSVMPRLDVLAVPSRREGMPMVIIEAMSVGVPVIATNVGGIAEAVVDGETGLLIKRSPEHLVHAIETVLHSREILGRLSARARVVFLERFEIRSIVERYDRVYSRED